MKIKSVAKGFTLIELLVVVMIIGILSAVALPMYRKAVEKSRVADALTTMQAVAKSEHGWYLTNNDYTKDFSDLDIDLVDANGNKADNASFANALYTYELLDTGIIADRNNGEYTLYKDYESSQILCTPGTHYICEDLGAFTKVPCEKVGMAWANKTSTCYVTNEDRCKDLYGNSMWNEDTTNPKKSYCGYTNTGSKTLDEGMICKAIGNSGCIYSTVNAGGVCVAYYGSGCQSGYFNGGICITKGGATNTCNISTLINGGICYGFCSGSSVSAGGICMGVEKDSCRLASVYDGGIAVCEGEGSCKFAGFYGTGCCCGAYCNPSKACDPDRCTEVMSKLDGLEALSKTMPAI